MNHQNREALWDIFRDAREDPNYQRMQIRYNDLEEQVGLILQSLPEHEQNTVWEFICMSDDMNLRILECLLGKSEQKPCHSERAKGESKNPLSLRRKGVGSFDSAL